MNNTIIRKGNDFYVEYKSDFMEDLRREFILLGNAIKGSNYTIIKDD